MTSKKFPIGFEEWIALPELHLPAIKAKTDTGAQTSALHAFMVEKFEDDEGVEKIKFGIHPIPEQPDIAVYCEANLVDERKIISSNGKMELRYIIRTLAKFGEHSWPIEISLTNRETMNYRMLIGRSAMEHQLVVVPDASFLLGKLDIQAYKNLKTQPHERKLSICILSDNTNGYSTLRLAQSAQGRGHEVHVLSPDKCYSEVATDKLSVRFKGKILKRFDAVIPRLAITSSYALAILRQFEVLGVYTLNTSHALTQAQDTLFTYQLLSRGKIPMAITAFGNAPSVTKDIIRVVGGAPLIIKLLKGTKNETTVFAETNKAAVAVIQAFRTLRANFIVQEHVHEHDTKEIRCLVLGHKVIASIQKKFIEGDLKNGNFLSNESTAIKLLKEERKLAVRSARILGLKFARVDLLRTKKGSKVLDVHAIPSLETLEKVRNMDLAGRVIEYVEHHARPVAHL